MDITWFGLSCFRLRSQDIAVVTDPFPHSLGLSMGEPSALAVTVSQEHPNYSFVDGVEGNPKVLKGPGEYELAGIYITGVMTPGSEEDPEEPRNTAYLIEVEGIRLCHLGNIKVPLANKQVEALSPVDVLLLPVGGAPAVELSQAIEMIGSLDPKIVIPMHYKVPYLKVKLGEVRAFLREMGIRGLQPQNRLNVGVANLPHEMRVVILEHQGKSPA